MLDTMSCLERFADSTRTHIDLAVRVVPGSPASVRVRNRFSSNLHEVVTCSSEGAFVTSWGYRLGTVDDIDAAAARLAYLLAAMPA
ncbi:hypothetical protein GCM10009677_56810 [Sphaerisporangium rubeum]|uniref:Uncharacterized protein n=1 Tax=Sphaerisporangium rubeum TaxID=321317 RepID=A0A7X0IDB7_9ACTN|nr:hypothetical protein [Sphaerisporangium rubeum]